jgi:hypothetical protein
VNGMISFPTISYPRLQPHPFVSSTCDRYIDLHSYTGKVYSLLLSEFRHVLFIDADNTPLQVFQEGERGEVAVYARYPTMLAVLSVVVKPPYCTTVLQDPLTFFHHPQYHLTGNLFWSDAWHSEVKDEAFKMHGLVPKVVKVS